MAGAPGVSFRFLKENFRAKPHCPGWESPVAHKPVLKPMQGQGAAGRNAVTPSEMSGLMGASDPGWGYLRGTEIPGRRHCWGIEEWWGSRGPYSGHRLSPLSPHRRTPVRGGRLKA